MSELPQIYVDFQNADIYGRLRLTCNGAKRDLKEQSIILKEGMKLRVYDEELQTMGVAKFSKEEIIWVAEIDWDQVRYY